MKDVACCPLRADNFIILQSRGKVKSLITTNQPTWLVNLYQSFKILNLYVGTVSLEKKSLLKTMTIFHSNWCYLVRRRRVLPGAEKEGLTWCGEGGSS